MGNSSDKPQGCSRITDCPMGIENRIRIEQLVDSDVKQWLAIDKIRDRLPNWAVITITLLTAILSACITLLFTQH